MKGKTFLVAAIAASVWSGAIALPHLVLAQGLPPIFADDPVTLAPDRSVAEFPVNTFLENIAIDVSSQV